MITTPSSASRWALHTVVLGLALHAPAFAEPGDAWTATGKSVEHWRALTRADVEAAAQLLEDNHPGASIEAGDEAFRARLGANRQRALERAAAVNGYAGYVATMSEFATSIGDRHVGFLEHYLPFTLDWPGFLIGRRGAQWLVTDEDPVKDGPSLLGARLISCDGEAVDDFAKRTLGTFRAVWTVEAQRMRAAPWLLVDEGNPFLRRPATCVFSTDGNTRTVALEWRTISRATLRPRMRTVGTGGAAGFGVERFGEGWWIALGELSDDARAVVAATEANAASMHEAQFVVLDLRGNDGGNSAFGRQIANALYGASYVKERVGESGQGANCATVWRVSPDNLSALDSYKVAFAEAGESATWQQLMDAAAIAVKAHRALTGAPTCVSRELPEQALPPHEAPAFAGRMVIVTDRECFSSCLLVVQDFLRLGAAQVGEATDQATHYTEQRVVYLPSGLAIFSTLMALDPALPALLGPFVPSVPYDGNIADTDALKRWLATVFAGRISTP